MQGSDIKVSDLLSPVPITGTQYVTTGWESRKWFGTVRARVGLLATPQVLLYATGGLAYGDTELSLTTQPFASPGVNCALGAACVSGTSSGTSIGWTAGVGLEWMFARNWSVKAEYLFIDLGAISATGATVNAVPPGSYTASTDFREHIARVGVNYKFDWGPVLGAY